MLSDNPFKKLNDAEAKRLELRDSFLRQLIVADTAILGILVSLYKSHPLSDLARIAFVVAVVLFGTAFLLLIVDLLGSINLYTKLVVHHGEK